jgi:O-acetyl-ADP-ribose deacetylase (regulator of RNase III)
MERQIGAVTITVEHGDISTMDADAVVNAANTQLWMGGGVAGAIKRAGGEQIERAAVAQGPIRIGEAVATPGGRLRARHVIHAATMGPDLVTNADAIRSATRSSLRLAEEMNLSSIALPLLGTGVGGFSQDEAASLMVTEIAGHARRTGRPGRVILVGFDAAAVRALEAALGGVDR